MAEKKTFKFTSAERGYLSHLVELAASAKKQFDIVNGEIAGVVGEAKQRLGLLPEARLLFDVGAGVFVLSPEDEGDAPIDLPAERAKSNGTAEPGGAK